ncbi:hypothetical protein C3L33_05482, partial [Rhododendron williamsianum]
MMDGDIVFDNRTPTTHKHSVQALSVYVHKDHTVKINPLIRGPLSADFDGDCVHLFYPQSLAAKAEVLELFSTEKQLLSSHYGNLNLQLAIDALLSLKIMFENYFLTRPAAQQLAMFVSNSLPHPDLFKAKRSGPQWTVVQLLQTALPLCFDCSGDRFLVRKSELLTIDFSRDVMLSIVSDIVSSIFSEKGLDELIGFLGLQISSRGKSYTRGLVEDMASLFHTSIPFMLTTRLRNLGWLEAVFFIVWYQEMAHSISAREVIVCSSRGLKEPGTLFKNLMAILRDVVICFDGTVRNVTIQAVMIIFLRSNQALRSDLFRGGATWRPTETFSLSSQVAAMMESLFSHDYSVCIDLSLSFAMATYK